MLPVDSPKLPKWPFFLFCAMLLGLAWYTVGRNQAPFSGATVIIVLGCVVCSSILAAIPLISDYARKQEEAFDERQRSLESLSRTVAASAEQISIAANGLNQLTELAQRNFKAAEQIAPRIQERIAAFKTEVGSVRDDETRKLKADLAAAQGAEAARLEAAADRIAKAVAEISKIQSAPSIPVPIPVLAEPAPIPDATIPEIAPVAPSDSSSGIVPRKRNPRKPKTETPPPGDAMIVAEEAPPPPTPDPQAANAVETPAAVPVEPPPPNPSTVDTVPNPPAKPRKSRAAATPAAPREEPRAASPSEPTLALEIETPVQQAEVVERVRSADGATRLLVTAYIGIGNRLFIRGEGPGLSWDKGVPLQFVSIGKWRWDTSEASGPVSFKLYKNDETECIALGPQSIEPGQQEEVVATF